MSALSCLLLVLGVGLGLILGAQTVSWSWGPALLVLGLAAAAAAMVRPASGYARSLAVPLLIAAGWIAWRCLGTPVLDDRRDDLLLLAAMLACAWVTGRLDPAGGAVRGLFAGLSLLAVANGSVALLQWQDPGWIWPYANKPVSSPTGFFGHYIDFSCFMGGVGLLGLSRLLVSRDAWWLKALHGLAFALVVVTIPLSGARGGLLGLGVGGVVFLTGWLIVLWRRRSKGFAPLAIALPFLVIGAVALIWPSLRQVETERISAAGLARFSDNEARLKFYNLALEVIDRHPWTGGGSRSYAWEKNLEWNPARHGTRPESEPFVHQEFLQTAAEYGWIGAGLVTAAVGALLVMQVVALFLGSSGKQGDDDLDPLRVAVLSSGACMLFQANFSFVFHLLPATLVLGILFGIGGPAVSGKRMDVRWPAWRRASAAGAGLLLALPLLVLGFSGARALHAIWPVLYARDPLATSAPGAAADIMRGAGPNWPGYQLAKIEGQLLRAAGDRMDLPNDERIRNYGMAAETYEAVLRLHPNEAGTAINLAILYSVLDRHEEAEAAFRRAIELQGGLEGAYQANFWYARHLDYLWDRRWKERRAGEALWGFREAVRALDEADRLGHWDNREERAALRRKIQQKIAFLEGAGVEARPPGPP